MGRKRNILKPFEPKPKKQKLNNNDTLETEYEQTVEDIPMTSLLPIKTKNALIPQEVITEPEPQSEGDDDEMDDGEVEEEQELTVVDDKFDLSKPISATNLLTERNKSLKQKKIHIGSLSAGVLEYPEEKVLNLRTLLKIMDDETPEIYYTVRKLVIVSLSEIFKDILPEYEIKKAINEGVKLKKDTMRLQKYEENLLLYYKKYLLRLEKCSSILFKKKNGSQVFNQEEIKLGELAVSSMCGLLVTHPYFNLSQNIAQTVVPFMNNPRKSVREMVRDTIKTVFKEDKKEEITVKILRLINNYLKNHAHNVHPEMLEPFIVLNLRDVNLDEKREQDIKQKKLKAHKQRVLQLSKKEKKKKKKLQALEKELLETKAEENKQTKQKNLTEITKIIFGIYFRILKSSTNTQIIGSCLEGLAKFSHCINVEFYMDLVNIIDKLLKEEWIDHRAKLHCIQTIFAILGGVGEALNIDPTRFYNTLYKELLTIGTSDPSNFLILLKILNDALVKRRKQVTNKRMISFVKRLSTLSLQLLHNGALSSLCLIRNIMQLNRSIDILLDCENTFGDGKFQPEMEEPEYANASTTSLYELSALMKHYHPVVRKYAKNIASGVPSTGDGCLEPQYSQCTPEQLYIDFDMSEMAFNPPVQVPKKVTTKEKVKE